MWVQVNIGTKATPPETDTTSFHGRLVQAVASACVGNVVEDPVVSDLAGVAETDLRTLGDRLRPILPGRFSLQGALDRRLLLAERPASVGGWVAADLSGRPHRTREWPDWVAGRLTLAEPDNWLSSADVTDEAAKRLTRPRVLLVALYHPEWFPLPRFPLAISDLARAARLTLMGEVQLMDMQLGPSIDNILSRVYDYQPDVVGISATFGQHDLMAELLGRLDILPSPPLVLAGGSLTVRNEAVLLESHPGLLIARGAGEPTIADIIDHFHGDRELTDVRGISYRGRTADSCGRVDGPGRTRVVPNRELRDFLPELDLLDTTLACSGVAQLEVSRGCTSHCSFCPRGHKGSWSGSDLDQLPWMLSEIAKIADRHPETSRTIYVVDEEFIGRGGDAVHRAVDVADHISRAGFSWESSCRIDQVVRPDRDRAWHMERAEMWRTLVAKGLRRMLFGVESGVASILQRFSKDVTPEQNVLAIRTLSALGVPPRFTYITFDQLMTAEELADSHAFQARADLLLRPMPEASVDEIVDGVTDEGFVAEHAVGRPFYTEISYMLVSMECLIGAPYTRMVSERGLAGPPDPSMGRVTAQFEDWRIGICSRRAQVWIDRHFALDYTLKSLEKLLEGESRRLVRNARVVLKDGSFRVLTGMLGLITTFSRENASSALDRELAILLEEQLSELVPAVSVVLEQVLPVLPTTTRNVLGCEFTRWFEADGWRLINADDPCGT